MFSKICFALCLACINALALGDSRTSAQDFVSAKVLASEGQVEIQRDASGGSARLQKITFKVDDELRAGDTIITGKNGKLVLGLSDGSQAVVAPKTTVVIKDLSQSPRTLFQMLKGKTRIHIEKLGGQPNPYRVNTPTAVIAVRGTIFDVLVEEDKTEVFLHEGEVAVINQALPDRSVLLTAGQMTQVRMQRQPNPPSAFKEGRNDGVFKMNHNERGGPPNNRQIAERGRQPDGGRGGMADDNNRRPEMGRGNPQDNRGGRPDGGRGGMSPTPNAGPGGMSPMPNSGPRPGGPGKKP